VNSTCVTKVWCILKSYDFCTFIIQYLSEEACKDEYKTVESRRLELHYKLYVVPELRQVERYHVAKVWFGNLCLVCWCGVVKKYEGFHHDIYYPLLKLAVYKKS
jgi:hypothetical protein